MLKGAKEHESKNQRSINQQCNTHQGTARMQQHGGMDGHHTWSAGLHGVVDTMGVIGIHPVYVRIAELWTLQKSRPLNDKEMDDFVHCMSWNVNRCWKHENLAAMSMVAYEVGDIDWHHDICAQIDAL